MGCVEPPRPAASPSRQSPWVPAGSRAMALAPGPRGEVSALPYRPHHLLPALPARLALPGCSLCPAPPNPPQAPGARKGASIWALPSQWRWPSGSPGHLPALCHLCQHLGDSVRLGKCLLRLCHREPPPFFAPLLGSCEAVAFIPRLNLMSFSFQPGDLVMTLSANERCSCVPQAFPGQGLGWTPAPPSTR